MANPTINGSAYDFTSIEFRAGTVVYPELTEIKYSLELKRKLVHASLPQPVAKAGRQVEPAASLKMLRSGFDRMVDTFGDGWMEIEFEIVLNYANEGQPIRTDTLQRVNIKKFDAEGSQGEDALEVSLELLPMGVLVNGKAPVKNMVSL